MSFPEKIKLTRTGEAVTLLVQKCAKAPVGKFPGIEFTGIDQFDQRLIVIEVPQSSADRQLGRIPLTYAEAVGCTLTISRDANSSDASKPFWGIGLASGSGHTKPAMTSGSSGPPEDDTPHPAARGTATEAPTEQTPRDIYLSITKSTLKEIVPLYVEAKIPVSMEAVAAIVATRFITATQRR